jgi:hypothetical protein
MKNQRFVANLTLPVTLAICLVLVLSLGSCSGSSSPTEPGDGGNTTGTLAINMIDDPTDEICELWIYIQDIRVKPDGQTPMLLGNDIGGWDLLSLVQGVEAPLGTWVVDAGPYQFIEMLLDESQSHVIERNLDDPGPPEAPNCFDEILTPLQIPSAKFKVNGGPFSVTAETTVTIDFDAKNSLKRKGSSNNPQGWQLNPKVSIVAVD